ncbi:MAG: hypothetical protein K6F99_00660 [Lachnospiraceae bacterium]|nr:hypothetical protein [Lachnospiraceae bacterium]
MSDTELIVEGYKFNSEADAARARDEVKKAAYIKARMNYDDPGSVKNVYEKMVSNRMFTTPVGNAFLKEVREKLIKSGFGEDEVSPLPLFSRYALEDETKEVHIPTRIIRPKEKVEYKKRFIFMAIVNAVLIVALIAMFAIAMNSDNPTILNYENAIQNKYAQWEMELTEREQAVKLRERALKMEYEGE